MKQHPKLLIKNLSKQHQFPVLQGISLHVLPGEIVSIIGPSGCGKSTLLDCIAGVVSSDDGDILIDGASIRNKRGLVSYMMQDDVLFPWRTVLDNVLFPSELAGRDKEAAKGEVEMLLAKFGFADVITYYPYQLSTGMRQRAALLRAYLCKKDVILMDEPFSKLDALTRFRIQQWFLGIWEQRKLSVLFVTHDIDEALALSDRIYVLSSCPATVLEEITVNNPRRVINRYKIINKVIQLLNAV